MEISLPAETTTVRHATAGNTRLLLWNPRAATYWGLLLSPAFSAYIHMRNWQTLGQEDQAAQARTWLRMVSAIIVAACFLPALGGMPGRDLELPSSMSLALLLAWHSWGGRGQERYIAAIIGGAYVRRPRSAKIFSALCMFIAFVVAIAAFSMTVSP
ncbi:hypothetical protein [Telluria beijingensis]|uniref:hypothetical protein n=1 Tax=Telluria beijingensis TaxID=3068633 RepID=UPI0027955411|nr:hypothetical protein [Massilia sp. REN29]